MKKHLTVKTGILYILRGLLLFPLLLISRIYKLRLDVSKPANMLFNQLRVILQCYKLYSKARSSSTKIIVYISDKSERAGLADRLRTIRAAYVFAAIHRADFYIYHDKGFKIEQYLEPNKVNWLINLNDIDFGLNNVIPHFYWTAIPQHIEINKQHHIYSTCGILDELDKKSIPQQYTDTYVHNMLFSPSRYLQTLVDNVMKQNNLIESSFIAVHTRFLNYLEQVEIKGRVTTTEEERNQMIQLVHSAISRIHSLNPDKPIVLFSDSNIFLNSKHQNYTIVLSGKVGHIAKKHDATTTDKTFIDLMIMSKASKIYSIRGKGLYGGAFAREAALIGNKAFIQFPLRENDVTGFIASRNG